jgi:N-acetylglucosamine-6-phosphate deacetylase
MTRAVSNIVALAGARPEEAARMASANPAAFLRVESDRGTLRPGARADLVMLDARLEARMTWIGGLRASDAYERAASLRKQHISWG